MSSPELVEIDGSILEGGGQILRNAISYSAILNIPIKVTKIRAGKDKPGLRPQHLSGLELVRDLCNGCLENAQIGSTEITFTPSTLNGGSFVVDTKTAGSVVLLMQVALPCALFSRRPLHLTMKGGTNAEFAPQIDYFTNVLKPNLNAIGIKFDVELIRRGFYPKGGGEVVLHVEPIRNIPAFSFIDKGHLLRIEGISFCAGVLPPKVSRLAAETAENVLKRCKAVDVKSVPIKIAQVVENERTAFGNGNGVILMAHSSTGCVLGADGLGKRGLAAEKVGEIAAQTLTGYLSKNICVDDFMQDQLIIFMALASGVSKIRANQIKLHAETAIHIAQLLTSAKFNTENFDDGTCVVECTGISLENPHI